MATYGGERYIVPCTPLVPTDVDGIKSEMIAVLFKEIQHYNNEKTLHSARALCCLLRFS